MLLLGFIEIQFAAQIESVLQRECLNVLAHYLQIVNVLLLQRAHIWIFDLGRGHNLRRGNTAGGHDEDQWQKATPVPRPISPMNTMDWRCYGIADHGDRSCDCSQIVRHMNAAP